VNGFSLEVLLIARVWECEVFLMQSHSCEPGEAMSQTNHIEPVKIAIRSSRTIIFASEFQIQRLRANFWGGVCGTLLD
jgi:hypothetical protein